MSVGPLRIVTVVPPDDLVGIYQRTDSGKLDPSLLVDIGPSGRLHHDAARAFNALAFICISLGLPLTYTYGGTYREYQSQVKLFLQRYTTTVLAGRPTKRWQGKLYYQRPGTAMAAVPGTSNHGWGIAVDFAFDSDPSNGVGPNNAATITSHPQWVGFKLAALACGWSWESTSEPWHLRLVTGSVPTQRVLDVEAFIAGNDTPEPPPAPEPPPEPPVPPEPTPAPTPPPPTQIFGDWPTTVKPKIQLDASGDVVAYMQGVFAKIGYAITVDGEFGFRTDGFVRWYQTDRHLTVDGIVGIKSWAAIDADAVA